jgi:hypothetical protein
MKDHNYKVVCIWPVTFDTPIDENDNADIFL